ncbi:hypothetical protein DFH06DRAFT_1349599 [Mycena polygramma]|nr:hypothetical protein DFH06DRAFT_1349599 [Mycena polygramma]
MPGFGVLNHRARVGYALAHDRSGRDLRQSSSRSSSATRRGERLRVSICESNSSPQGLLRASEGQLHITRVVLDADAQRRTRRGDGHERVQYISADVRINSSPAAGVDGRRPISRLLDTKGGDFALACGLDFVGIGLYDASRFGAHTVPEWECFVIAYDMHLRTPPKRSCIYADPKIKVATASTSPCGRPSYRCSTLIHLLGAANSLVSIRESNSQDGRLHHPGDEDARRRKGWARACSIWLICGSSRCRRRLDKIISFNDFISSKDSVSPYSKGGTLTCASLTLTESAFITRHPRLIRPTPQGDLSHDSVAVARLRREGLLELAACWNGVAFLTQNDSSLQSLSLALRDDTPSPECVTIARAYAIHLRTAPQRWPSTTMSSLTSPSSACAPRSQARSRRAEAGFGVFDADRPSLPVAVPPTVPAGSRQLPEDPDCHAVQAAYTRHTWLYYAYGTLKHLSLTRPWRVVWEDWIAHGLFWWVPDHY